MSESITEVDSGSYTLSRREFNKALAGGITAGAAAGMLGVGVIWEVVDHSVDHRSSYEKSVPKDFLTRNVEEWSTSSVESIRKEADIFRSSTPLVFDKSSRTGFLEGGGVVSGGNTAEITFSPIFGDIPTYDTFEVVANGQRRLVVIAALPDPRSTTVQFDKFDTENVDVDIIKKSSGQIPLLPDQIHASISHFTGRCSAEVIAETMNGILPWDEVREDPGKAAPFQGFSVLYVVDDMPAVLHVSQMLWEEKGTKVSKLYFDTKDSNGNTSPGRTIDSEWTTLIIFHPDGSREIKIQRPHHTTGWYDGELENGGVRPVIKPETGNYNFRKATKEEVSEAQFAYRNKIMSPQEYAYRRNRPNPYIQWLSLVGHHQRGRISGMNDPVVKDFLSFHPEMKGFTFPRR